MAKQSGFDRDMQRAKEGRARTRRAVLEEAPSSGQRPGREQPEPERLTWGAGDSGRPSAPNAHEGLEPRSYTERNC
jgi:hypothetical protein